MIVNQTKPNLLHVNGKKLMPGPNKVDLKWWSEARKHPSIQKRLDAGTIIEEQDFDEMMAETEQGENTEAESTLDVSLLKDMKANQAISVVKETTSIELLTAWLGVEERASVVKVIEKQIAELKTPLEDLDRNQARQIVTGKGPEVVELTANPGPQDD